MKKYALLTLAIGDSHYFGLRENNFNYPPRKEELQLFDAAIASIKEHPYLTNYYWSLIEIDKQREFENYLIKREETKEQSPYVIVPTQICHGRIHFKFCFRFDGYGYEDKELLVQKCIDSEITPDKGAFDLTFQLVRMEREGGGIPIEKERMDSEIKQTFSRNLNFYSE